MQYSSEYFTLDVYIVGFFMAFCILVGLFLFLTDHIKEFSGAHNFTEFSQSLGKLAKGFINIAIGREIFNEQKSETDAAFVKDEKGTEAAIKKVNRFPIRLSGVSFIFLILMMTYVCGVISNSLSDRWMDSRNIYHSGLKVLWWNPHEESPTHSYTRTDDDLKIKSFDHLIGKNIPAEINISNYDKIQMYYQARNHIVKDGTFAQGLQDSQVLVNFSQSLSLSFFILLVFAGVNFTSLAYRHLGIKMRNVLIALIILVLVFATLKITQPQLVGMLFDKHAWPGFTGYLVIGFLLFPALLITTFVITKQKVLLYRFLLTVGVFYFSFFGYYGNSLNWKHNEKAVTNQVYGYYKYLQQEKLGLDAWEIVTEVNGASASDSSKVVVPLDDVNSSDSASRNEPFSYEATIEPISDGSIQHE